MMHLEKYRGEGSITRCGLDAVARELDILNEDQAEEWVPEEVDMCKSCMKTIGGIAVYLDHKGRYELAEDRWREEEA